MESVFEKMLGRTDSVQKSEEGRGWLRGGRSVQLQPGASSGNGEVFSLTLGPAQGWESCSASLGLSHCHVSFG